MYTQYDDLINDKLNKTNDTGELSLAPVPLLQSQFGHASLVRVLSVPLLHTYMSPGHVPDPFHESSSLPGFALHASVRSRTAAPCPALTVLLF